MTTSFTRPSHAYHPPRSTSWPSLAGSPRVHLQSVDHHLPAGPVSPAEERPTGHIALPWSQRGPNGFPVELVESPWFHGKTIGKWCFFVILWDLTLW